MFLPEIAPPSLPISVKGNFIFQMLQAKSLEPASAPLSPILPLIHWQLLPALPNSDQFSLSPPTAANLVPATLLVLLDQRRSYADGIPASTLAPSSVSSTPAAMIFIIITITAPSVRYLEGARYCSMCFPYINFI